MHEGISPEEKLLKHIRKPNGLLSPKAVSPQKSTYMNVVSERTAEKKKKRIEPFPYINTALIVISIVLFGYSVYQFFFVKKDVGALEISLKAIQEDPKQQKISLPEPKPYSVYAQQIDERDIFESPLQRKKGNTGAAANSSAPELTKNLKIVGIVLDDTKEVIIEDLEAKSTFFLHEGEKIKGAVIEEIQESKVILLFNEQRVELIQ